MGEQGGVAGLCAADDNADGSKIFADWAWCEFEGGARREEKADRGGGVGMERRGMGLRKRWEGGEEDSEERWDEVGE
jgi:hypothetical protein